MKRIFTYIIGGVLVMSQVASAAPDERQRGRGRAQAQARVSASANAQSQSSAARQSVRSVQRPAAVRQSIGNTRQAVRSEMPRSAARAETRVIPNRNQTTVARTSREGTARSTTSQTAIRSTANTRQYDRDGRDWDRNRDRDRDGDRWRDRDRDRDRGRDWSDRRYYRPPITIYRNWDHDRVYSWNNNRWRWYGGNWVIYDASPSVVYTTEALPAIGSSTVASVQEELQDKGYDPGPADGVMGGRTRSAIAAYQEDHGLAVTGTINNPLLQSLDLI